MHMDEGLDTGAVLMEERVTIGRRTAGELTNELARMGASLMGRALAALERGSIAERRNREKARPTPRKFSKRNPASTGRRARTRSIA